MFYCWIHWKKFQKFWIVNFRFPYWKKNLKFFTAEFIENNFQNFLQSISLKKNSIFFRKIRKKTFLPKQKKRVTGRGQFFQKNPTRPCVGLWCLHSLILVELGTIFPLQKSKLFGEFLYFPKELNAQKWCFLTTSTIEI